MSAQLPIRVPVTPECEVIPEGDNDTAKIFAACKKNPGHPNLYSIDNFEKHIPENLRTTEFVDSIQRMIDRTVKIFVKYTSKERPSVYPGTNKPYPYCKMRGKGRIGRCGTGFLLSDNMIVEKSGKPCPCHICRESSQPKMKFWATSVYTAAHVIFDNSEASNSVYECFYHSNDKSNVEYFYGTSVKTEADRDSAEVMCVTHDEGLLAKLNLLHKVIKLRDIGVETGATKNVKTEDEEYCGKDVGTGSKGKSDNEGKTDHDKCSDEVKDSDRKGKSDNHNTDNEGKTDSDKSNDEVKDSDSKGKSDNEGKTDNDKSNDEVKDSDRKGKSDNDNTDNEGKTDNDKSSDEVKDSDRKGKSDNDNTDNERKTDNDKSNDEVKDSDRKGKSDNEGKTDNDKSSDEVKHADNGRKAENGESSNENQHKIDNEGKAEIDNNDEVKHTDNNRQTDSKSSNEEQQATDTLGESISTVRVGVSTLEWGAQKMAEFKKTLKDLTSLFPDGQNPFNQDSMRQLSHLMSNLTAETGELTGKDRYKESYLYTAVIVSHPHGCSKKVSIGQVLGFQIVIDEKITPGSPVLFIGDTICHLPLPPEDAPEQPWPICLTPEFSLKPGQSAVLPKDMEYVIPLDSEYLYKIMLAVPKALSSPAAKSVLKDVYAVAAASGIHYSHRFDIFRLFPPGTQFFLHGKEIILPPEAEFYCDQRFDDSSTGSKSSFMIYDTCTCPGSSGALLNVGYFGINIPLLCHTHQGALSTGVNISSFDIGNSWGYINQNRKKVTG